MPDTGITGCFLFRKPDTGGCPGPQKHCPLWRLYRGTHFFHAGSGFDAKLPYSSSGSDGRGTDAGNRPVLRRTGRSPSFHRRREFIAGSCRKLLPYTDIWIPDEGTVAKTLGVSRGGLPEISGDVREKDFFTAVTLGDKGAVGLQGDRFFTAMPYRVPVTDTTGAGDNYHGAFLYA